MSCSPLCYPAVVRALLIHRHMEDMAILNQRVYTVVEVMCTTLANYWKQPLQTSCRFSLYIPPGIQHHPQSSSPEKEYAFEMASSSIRYGNGVTQEVGWDVVNLGIKNLIVITDKNVCIIM